MSNEVIQVPITDELDLHNFSPKEIVKLIPDYIQECCLPGLYQVRIVDRNGKGMLRTCVHSIIKNTPTVINFRIADETKGGLGATLVTLQPIDQD